MGLIKIPFISIPLYSPDLPYMTLIDPRLSTNSKNLFVNLNWAAFPLSKLPSSLTQAS
jgi:hypothetical protein